MHGHQRSERMAAQLQRLLAVMIRDDVRDPRVAGVTITATQVSRDLSHAKVYLLDENPDASRAAAAVLNRAAGFLRSKVAAHLTTRSVPTLKFLYDETLDNANRMEVLIAQARARDADSGDTLDDDDGDAGSDGADNEAGENNALGGNRDGED